MYSPYFKVHLLKIKESTLHENLTRVLRSEMGQRAPLNLKEAHSLVTIMMTYPAFFSRFKFVGNFINC